jgi:hypothetical protein
MSYLQTIKHKTFLNEVDVEALIKIYMSGALMPSLSSDNKLTVRYRPLSECYTTVTFNYILTSPEEADMYLSDNVKMDELRSIILGGYHDVMLEAYKEDMINSFMNAA